MQSIYFVIPVYTPFFVIPVKTGIQSVYFFIPVFAKAEKTGIQSSILSFPCKRESTIFILSITEVLSILSIIGNPYYLSFPCKRESSISFDNINSYFRRNASLDDFFRDLYLIKKEFIKYLFYRYKIE